MTTFRSLESYRKKFYLKRNGFKNFLELSEEHLSELSKKICIRREQISDILSHSSERILKLERYQRTLQYLTNPLIHLDLETFDERLAYLIMMTDPDLVIFKEFLKTNIVSMAEISKAEDEKERECLMKLRRQTVSKYESTVREKIGFFDPNLLKYEEIFFKRFFNKKELVTEVEINNQDEFIMIAKSVKDFDSISNERYEELVSISHGWLALVSEKHNSKVATYSVTNQKELLGLTNLKEQLVMFILLVDGDLDMLRIYEEESMMQNIEERIVEQFGYFNSELLVLERKFHDRFCPDKDLSIWSKTKKD